MLVNFRDQAGIFRQARIGYSWTVLFLGFLVPLYRKDWYNGFFMCIISCLTLGIANILFSFIYNKHHIRKLLDHGFLPADEHSKMILVTKGYAKFNITVVRPQKHIV